MEQKKTKRRMGANMLSGISFAVNGRHPVTAVVHYADGSGTHIYRSTDLPLKVDWRIVGQSVKVYLDTADPEKYHVDTDELLERCAIR